MRLCNLPPIFTLDVRKGTTESALVSPHEPAENAGGRGQTKPPEGLPPASAQRLGSFLDWGSPCDRKAIQRGVHRNRCPQAANLQAQQDGDGTKDKAIQDKSMYQGEKDARRQQRFDRSLPGVGPTLENDSTEQDLLQYGSNQD